MFISFLFSGNVYQIDLRFPLDGSVRLHFSTSPESRLMGVNETHTRYTVESSTGKNKKQNWIIHYIFHFLFCSFLSFSELFSCFNSWGMLHFPPAMFFWRTKLSTPGQLDIMFCSQFLFFVWMMYAGDPVVRWDSYDTVTDSASCSDDHHHHDVSSSAGSTQSE